jgi:hypothetical protein
LNGNQSDAVARGVRHILVSFPRVVLGGRRGRRLEDQFARIVAFAAGLPLARQPPRSVSSLTFLFLSCFFQRINILYKLSARGAT